MTKKLISLWFAGRMGAVSARRRRRSLALATVLAAILAAALPLSTQALGFGAIKLKSALNEPLDAEIDLLAATAADVDALKVRLAPREAFLRAGIERQAVLHEIKFSVERRANGTYYIHLKTRQPVREPFLNFLLEMEWPNGRMLREYTVLLDPPELFHRQPTFVEAPETAEPAPEPQVAQAEPAPEPAPLVPEPAPAPAAQAEPEPLFGPDVTPAPEPEPQVAEAPAEPAPLVPEPAAEAAPEPEPILAPEPAPEAVPEPEPQLAGAPAVEEGEELFPRIPLTEYREAVAAAAAEEAAPAEPMVGGELDYGITQKGDTLWQIAERLKRDDSVSIYQVMMALLQSNPEAFVDGNVHRLKVGRVMRISDPSLLYAMSAEEAAAEYRRQTEAWNEYRQQVAQVETTPQPIVAGEAGEGAAVAQAEPEGELSVEAPAGEPAPGAGTAEQAEAQSAALIALRDEVQQALDQARADPNANPEQISRLSLLLDEIKRLEGAVNVQDTDLAALQAELARLHEEGAQPAPQVAEAPASQAPAEEAAGPGAQEAPEQPSAQPAEEQVAAAEPEAAPAGESAPAAGEEAGAEAGPEAGGLTPEEIAAGETPPTEAPETAVEEAEVVPAEGVTPAEGEAAPQPVGQVAEAPVPAPAEEAPQETGGFRAMVSAVLAAVTGVLGGLGGSPILIAVAGTALVVLLLGIILIRRRRALESGEESILTGEAEGAEGGAGGGDVASKEESSFLSDFAISGMNAIQAEDSEVDPVTEADVFMAYGRYEAAEERLKDAIGKDPGRMELKLKLLELYYTTKNKSAFENAAAELYGALGEQAESNPDWAKVVSMGVELAPDNPLFAGGTPSSDSIKVGADMSDSEIMDIGLETGVFDAAEMGQQATAGDVNSAETMITSSSELDFSLDAPEPAPDTTLANAGQDISELPTETVAEPAPAQSAPSEAFKVGDLGTGGAGSEAFTAGGLDEPVKSEEFDLDVGESAPAKSEEFDLDLAASAPAQSEELVMKQDFDPAKSQEFNLDDLQQPAGPASSQEFNLDADLSPAGGSDETMLDLGLDATDAAGEDVGLDSAVDEVGTKLDLAKAYIDMGDPDGARSILGEVLEEGTDAQKQEAQQLMQQIA